jgi:hypothetical protein
VRWSTNSSRFLGSRSPSLTSTAAARGESAIFFFRTSQIAGRSGRILHVLAPMRESTIAGWVRWWDSTGVGPVGARSPVLSRARCCNTWSGVVGRASDCSSFIARDEVSPSASYRTACCGTWGLSSCTASSSTLLSPSAIDCVYAGGVTMYKSALLVVSTSTSIGIGNEGLKPQEYNNAYLQQA